MRGAFYLWKTKYLKHALNIIIFPFTANENLLSDDLFCNEKHNV